MSFSLDPSVLGLVNTFISLDAPLSRYVPVMPSLLVGVACCVIAIAKWGEAPRAALWGVLGFGILVMLSLLMPVMSTILQSTVLKGATAEQTLRAMTIMSFLASLLHAAADVFLLIAIFAGRRPKT